MVISPPQYGEKSDFFSIFRWRVPCWGILFGYSFRISKNKASTVSYGTTPFSSNKLNGTWRLRVPCRQPIPCTVWFLVSDTLYPQHTSIFLPVIIKRMMSNSFYHFIIVLPDQGMLPIQLCFIVLHDF